jgi:hypothetical protein
MKAVYRAEEARAAQTSRIEPRRRQDCPDGFLTLNPFRVPIEIALVAIDDVARLFELVKLARVNHQLGWNAKAAQGLIHLLDIEKRNVKVVLATKEQCWSLDSIRVQKRI